MWPDQREQQQRQREREKNTQKVCVRERGSERGRGSSFNRSKNFFFISVSVFGGNIDLQLTLANKQITAFAATKDLGNKLATPQSRARITHVSPHTFPSSPAPRNSL